jgi:hypothetical protein
VTGFQTFASAGVANGDVVSYAIDDGNNFEYGNGTYTSADTTLSRTVVGSNNSNTAISVTTSAQVYITALAGDIVDRDSGTANLLTATGLRETRSTVTAASTTTLNCSTANVFYIALNAAITTLAFSNVPTTGTAYSLTLQLAITTGSITWPTSVKWGTGTAPTLSATGKTDTFVLMTHDGGTTWWAFVAGQGATT